MGSVSVEYETVPGTATAGVGNSLKFGFDQLLSTLAAESFHSFVSDGKSYMLLASSHRKNAVMDNAVSPGNLREPFKTVLFTWQGKYVPKMVSTT